MKQKHLENEYKFEFWENKMSKLKLEMQYPEREPEKVKNSETYLMYEMAKRSFKAPIFFHNNNFVTVSLIRSDYGYEVATNIINRAFKTKFTKDQTTQLCNFIIDYRTIDKKPHLVVQNHVFESNGELRDILKNEPDLKEAIQKPVAHFEPTTGRIELFPGIPNINDITEKELFDFHKLIRMIVGTGEEYETFMNYLAQVILENRSDKSGRATLLLYGERGTGKSFLVQHVIRSLLPNSVTNLPPNFAKFNGFLQNKIVFRDENEAEEISPLSLYRFAKELSGATRMTVNKKNIEAYTIPVSTFLIIMSNEKPLEIRDYPTNKFNNQWLAITCDNILNNNRDYFDLVNDYSQDFTPYIRRVAGAFIYEVLVPLYRRNVKEYRNTRYGFPIPINNNVRELCDSSLNNYEVMADMVLETLCKEDRQERLNYLDQFSDKFDLLKHWELFDDSKCIITNKLLTIFANKRIDVTPRKFTTFLKKNKYWQGAARKKIDGTLVRGVYFNKEKYLKDVEIEVSKLESVRIKDVEYKEDNDDLFN
jgi:hypothetical protein